MDLFSRGDIRVKQWSSVVERLPDEPSYSRMSAGMEIFSSGVIRVKQWSSVVERLPDESSNGVL